MKFLHTADLHIGKVVNDFSMLEDQKDILNKILWAACENNVDAIVIAGDIYDRSIPPAEAVAVFDDFITRVVEAGIQVVLIAGNHDSQERVSFLENILCRQGVHIAGVVKEKLSRFTLEKDGILTEFVLLPFCRPAQVQCQTSQEAVQKLLEGYWKEEKEQEPGPEKMRVLVTHFFVTNGGHTPELSDSETTIHVGSLDNVDASVLKGFDYVALGHIHKAQQIGEEHIYYAGTPLKYSFGESNQVKSVSIVELCPAKISVKKVPLVPQHDMRKIKGTLQELLDQGREEGASREDYIQACLTDSGELLEPMETLRSVYPNVMQIIREREDAGMAGKEFGTGAEEIFVKRKEPNLLFEEFYHEVQGTGLTEEQKAYIQTVVRELEEN